MSGARRAGARAGAGHRPKGLHRQLHLLTSLQPAPTPTPRISTPVNAARLASTLGARISIVPDSGHLSHEEAPGPLLALLAPWAAQLAGNTLSEGPAASAML